VIARLDDTNLRAALNAARAQLDYARSGLAETEVNLKTPNATTIGRRACSAATS